MKICDHLSRSRTWLCFRIHSWILCYPKDDWTLQWRVWSQHKISSIFCWSPKTHHFWRGSGFLGILRIGHLQDACYSTSSTTQVQELLGNPRPPMARACLRRLAACRGAGPVAMCMVLGVPLIKSVQKKDWIPSWELTYTYISPKNGILKMIFLFDMLIPWRVGFLGKVRWHWKITMLNRRYILKWLFFQPVMLVHGSGLFVVLLSHMVNHH